MSTPALETFLARLYTDAPFREAFLRDPSGVAAGAGLDSQDCAALAAIDRTGLRMAATSYAAKRAGHAERAKAGKTIGSKLRNWIRPRKKSGGAPATPESSG